MIHKKINGDKITYCKNIKWSDINSGASPKTIAQIPLPDLGRYEIITDVFVQLVANWVDSSSINDLDFVGITEIVTIEVGGTVPFPDVIVPFNSLGNYFTDYIDYLYCAILQPCGATPSLSTVRSLFISLTATDLTKLTAGEFNVYYVTKNLTF